MRQATRKTDTTPNTQNSTGTSNRDGGNKPDNGAESSQSASSSKTESTTDIKSEGSKSKKDAVHANSTKSEKPTQHYRLTDQDGKTYDGVGDVDGKRAAQSKKKLEKENPGKNFTIETTNYPNRAEAYKAEDRGIQSSGGPQGKDPEGANYNKINSPGKKLNDEAK